ncbi:hypothetical protein SAY87_029025 [Trapa incisa]|uniref:CTLH/CRA C-terminal to LisH motif domain-containing protein n=1 Tax=Trapa incisa TaxID=236973 RepID=A0AAN7L3F8_9MYRT|nr:hypothetical protein SAY87_029025 [Trapa incisa]
MGCLLFAGKPEASPYAELLRTLGWDKLVAQVTQQYFNLLGQPAESPLSVTIAAGFQALPTLLKFINGMLGKKQDWHSLKQLPVPVELDDKFQFHSIFICPVSKEGKICLKGNGGLLVGGVNHGFPRVVAATS